MFELISSYKGLVIALILTNGELLKIELFDDTCAEASSPLARSIETLQGVQWR
jgi:hypothetical protein